MDDHKNSSIDVFLSQGTNDWVDGQPLQEPLCFAHDGTFTPSDLQLAKVGLVSLTKCGEPTSSWGLCLPIRPVSYAACMSGVSTEDHPLHQGCLPISHPPLPVASPAPGQACWSQPSSLGMCRWGGCGLTVKQPIRLCSKGRWKARGSPHQSSSSVAALWKLAGFCKCCGRERRQHEVPGMQTAR